MNQLLVDLPGAAIELNGVDYYVRDSQEGSEAVLFLHGVPDDGNLWRQQIPIFLEAGYRVLCPDLLGAGQTERPAAKERYRFDAMAADVAALMEHLGLAQAPVHLIAHDFGTALGWILAGLEEFPAVSYAALSLGHANAFFSDLSLENARWQWNLFLNHHPSAVDMYRANDGALFKALARSHPDHQVIFERLDTEAPDSFEALFSWEEANSLPQLIAAGFAGQLPSDLSPPARVPTLGLWSSGDDYLWETQMKDSGQHVDGAWRYQRIEDAGHWLMLDKPGEVNELLLAWVREAAKQPRL
jgi:pimeloyl-ACP methyl ester carboxylesterase